MMGAIEDIVAERSRQIATEGFTADHDRYHSTGELALAAATYAYSATLSAQENSFHAKALYGVSGGVISVIRLMWPWEARWFKPKSKRQDLVRAGALIVAEIERMDSAAS